MRTRRYIHKQIKHLDLNLFALSASGKLLNLLNKANCRYVVFADKYRCYRTYQKLRRSFMTWILDNSWKTPPREFYELPEYYGEVGL